MWLIIIQADTGAFKLAAGLGNALIVTSLLDAKADVNLFDHLVCVYFTPYLRYGSFVINHISFSVCNILSRSCHDIAPCDVIIASCASSFVITVNEFCLISVSLIAYYMIRPYRILTWQYLLHKYDHGGFFGACASGHASVVALLLDANVDVNRTYEVSHSSLFDNAVTNAVYDGYHN
jgi:hypothetical protein